MDTFTNKSLVHYNDVIMTTIASQITSLAVVYSTVYSDADQRKHQSSASLAFVWGIHQSRWIPRTKGQLRGKCFHLMTSSWIPGFVADGVSVIDTKMESSSRAELLTRKTWAYLHGPLTRYAKLRVAHAPEMPGMFSPPPQVSDPDMHHVMCVTNVSWCIPESLTNGFL